MAVGEPQRLMLELFAEGVDSLRLPCSYVVLAPLIGLSLFAWRRSGIVVAAFACATALLVWLRFAGWWFAAPGGVLQVVLGVGLIALAVLAFRIDLASTDALLGASAGIVAAWSWIPCVGPELGSLINRVGDAPFTNGPGTMAFIAGLLSPFILLGAALATFPKAAAFGDRVGFRPIGTAITVMLGLLMMFTVFDDLASFLAERSTF